MKVLCDEARTRKRKSRLQRFETERSITLRLVMPMCHPILVTQAAESRQKTSHYFNASSVKRPLNSVTSARRCGVPDQRSQQASLAHQFALSDQTAPSGPGLAACDFDAERCLRVVLRRYLGRGMRNFDVVQARLHERDVRRISGPVFGRHAQLSARRSRRSRPKRLSPRPPRRALARAGPSPQRAGGRSSAPRTAQFGHRRRIAPRRRCRR